MIIWIHTFNFFMRDDKDMVNFTNKYQSLELISNDKSKLIYVSTNTETNERVVLKLYKKTD